MLGIGESAMAHSDWFEVEQGVRQGCVLSLWLFNLYMDTIVREAREKFVEGGQLEETTVQLLLFADLMLMAGKDEDMERNQRMLEEVMEKWRMQINWKKTKVLTVKQGGGTSDIHSSERGED